MSFIIRYLKLRYGGVFLLQYRQKRIIKHYLFEL